MRKDKDEQRPDRCVFHTKSGTVVEARNKEVKGEKKDQAHAKTGLQLSNGVRWKMEVEEGGNSAKQARKEKKKKKSRKKSNNTDQGQDWA